MRNFIKRYLQTTALGITLLFFVGIAFAAPIKPSNTAELALYSGTDRQQILEEGAKKEKTLTFYTSGILTQAVRPVVNEFQKKYPYIKVEIWRADTNVVSDHGGPA